jgi:RNA polymerase sigma-70 factor (ECF subfamily)
MWRHRGSFEPARGSLEGWLFTVGVNAIRDECRRRRREVATVSVDDLQIPAFDDLDVRIRLADLRTALGSMEPGARELIAMRYALDLSVADMAAFTGKSPNAVSVALHRALTTLRHIMEGDPT